MTVDVVVRVTNFCSRFTTHEHHLPYEKKKNKLYTDMKPDVVALTGSSRILRLKPEMHQPELVKVGVLFTQRVLDKTYIRGSFGYFCRKVKWRIEYIRSSCKNRLN